jgi:hypothetical protein
MLISVTWSLAIIEEAFEVKEISSYANILLEMPIVVKHKSKLTAEEINAIRARIRESEKKGVYAAVYYVRRPKHISVGNFNI